jgi:hypothetical protein
MRPMGPLFRVQVTAQAQGCNNVLADRKQRDKFGAPIKL